MNLSYQPPRQATVITKLNLRLAPSTAAARVGRLEPGAQITVESSVDGDTVLGRDRWLKLQGVAQYVWAGGVTVLEPDPIMPSSNPTAMPVGSMPPEVYRRPNNSIRPLTGEQISAVYGAFDFDEGPRPGEITITTPGWEAQHLEDLTHPLLLAMGYQNLRVNKLALPHFNAVFDAIQSQGLANLVLTCGGTFVPRHVGWRKDVKELSSHSWGIAIDLNERWNGQPADPALPGELGSVRELVPLFAAQGFAWGGDFSKSKDGMHFELARTNP
jgi:hypothetical protein